jgi:dGTPase
MDKIKELAFAKIYNYRKAMEIEAAGFEVLGGLMKAFLKAVFLDTKHDKQIRTLIPKQYLNPELSKYDKIMNIIQFVSGMTDTFALDTFRAIKGISLPSY